MSKRKRAPKPPDGESAEDATKDDMVHVTSELLAGSPEIFAGKRGEGAEAPSETRPAEAEASTEEPSAEPAPEPEPRPEPEAAPAAEAPPPAAVPEAEMPAAVETAAPTSTPPATVTTMPRQPALPSRGGSSTALGIVLVVVGLFALVVVLIPGVDLTQSGWPLFIIIPGLTLMVVGFLSVGAVATIPGGIVTMVGVVLAYCSATGDWPFWAYGWALVTPGGVGLGIYAQAVRDRDQQALRTGLTLLFISLLIFLIGFVLFESILGISGRDYFGPYGRAAFPVLMIVIGVILLVRRMQQNRQR